MQVLVVFYSRYGNTAMLAEGIAEGVRAVDGAEAVIRRVEDLAPEAVVERDERWRHTRQDLIQKYQVAKLSDLESADAVVLGSANRYGHMAAELKEFLDSSGPIWVARRLENKVGAVFSTTSTEHSGLEAGLLGMMVPLYHFGMIVVGVGPGDLGPSGAGSIYGATAITGPASNQPPTEEDMEVARSLGRRVAQLTTWIRQGQKGSGVQ